MSAAGATERVFELLDSKPEPGVWSKGKPIDDFRGLVTAKDLEFAYPSRPDLPVLKGVSFTLEPGSRKALVGPSGSGKSTIVGLLSGLYPSDKGSIDVDGVTLGEIDRVWLHSRMALVSQEPSLFAGTIRDNIVYGDRDGVIDEDKLEKAVQDSNSNEFISKFPEGLDSLVGERGVRMSGGQKQRIAIARALYLNPTILLLDEATSALDSESEFLVQQALDRLITGRTVLVIAHRLSTVRDANEVMVVADGQIAARGSHDELMKTSDLYKNLVKRQLTPSATETT